MLASEWWIIAFYYDTLYTVTMKYKIHVLLVVK